MALFLMKYLFLIITGVAIMLGGGMILFNRMHQTREFLAGSIVPTEISATPTPIPEKTIEERIKEAREKSSHIKGIYMTAEVANDGGAGATRLRNQIIGIADTTEVNGIVIDVKEVCGPEYNKDRMKKLIDELHVKNIWAIARIVVFKDASQINVHPEWYLKRAVPKFISDQCANKLHLRVKNSDGSKPDAIFWRDNNGGYWLDPASGGVHDYIADFSKKIIDLGFDEIQFDYIRFPSDGDVAKAQFPAWNGKTPKFMVMKDFFEFLDTTLRKYKPDIMLSLDMFGYAAIQQGDVGIGQRLEDIGSSFDYVSFMVYPSHYYSGLSLPADMAHNLPAINYNKSAVRVHPDVTVGRSLRVAQNFLDNLAASSTAVHTREGTTSATSTSMVVTDEIPQAYLRLRPWLEDFFHEADKLAGRPYGVEKVRLQIDAAEKTGGHGWILWNAANVYTEKALKSE